ncbi:pilin [Hydrogenophaga sp.]|uniref:pilin n=1 Tax=Hydrogenophaga sp. TaxID=1904254 RepID=UPI003D0F2C04
MQKLQQGFTLIELMIVVAIIGILAALAVPAYQDYTIRSKVSEGASLASAARTAVDVYYSENGTLPGSTVTNTSLGLAPPASYNAKYVASVNVYSAAAGDIVVTYQTLPELGTASGDTLRYLPVRQGGNLQWTIATTGTSLPEKYKPRL